MLHNMLAFGMLGPVEGIILVFLPLLFAPLIALLPIIFYLLTLKKALNKCSIENRTISPGSLWLYLIPVFNLFWHFVIVINMASSLGNEFKKRQIQADPTPGKNLGLAMCILVVCSILPAIGLLSLLAALICWVLYWIKIADYSKLLITEEVLD